MATLHSLRSPANLPVALLSQAIHRLSRHELEDLAQSLIDHLDAQDGDPDLEDDDPAGGNPEDDGEQLDYVGLPLPIYGVDQRREPLNHRKVWDSYTYDPATGVHSLLTADASPHNATTPSAILIDRLVGTKPEADLNDGGHREAC